MLLLGLCFDFQTENQGTLAVGLGCGPAMLAMYFRCLIPAEGYRSKRRLADPLKMTSSFPRILGSMSDQTNVI